MNVHKKTLMFVFLVLTFIVLTIFANSATITRGIIPIGSIVELSPLVHNGTMFIGNGNGNLKAINKQTGKEAWSIQLSESIGSSVRYDHGSIYVTTVDGVLYAIDAKTGNERWRYHASEGYVFETSLISGSSLLFIGDTYGILHAVDRKNGELVWQFKQQKISADVVDRPYGPNWFGQLKRYKNRIIVGGADGVVYALREKTGKELWRVQVDGAASALEANNNFIFVTTKNGEMRGITLDGQTRWTASGIGRVSYILFLKREHLAISIASMMPARAVPPQIARQYLSVITFTKEGEVVSRDIRSGEIFYSTHTDSEVTTFPTLWSTCLFVSVSQKGLIKIDGLSGKKMWLYKTEDEISTSPRVVYRNFPMQHFCNRWGGYYWVSRMCLVTVIVGDISGNIQAIRANSGNSIWKFRMSGPAAFASLPDGNRLISGSQDGNIYNTSLFNGTTQKPLLWRKLTLEQNTHMVSGGDILELTLTYKDDSYPSPWKDILVDATLVSPLGDHIKIGGYYYDKSTWKLKFNPSVMGEWQYTVKFSLPDKTLVRSGQFVSAKTTENAYLHVFESEGGKYVSTDGKARFPIVGIGDVIDDANCNGNLLDDFFVGGGNTSPDIDIFNKYCNGLNTFTSDEYLSQYKGFNIFRWSVNNASFNLWKYTDPSQNRPQIFEGKMGDELAMSAVKANMKLWMTFYSWDLPNEDRLCQKPVYMHMIKQYIRYVIARYGAYVSIWELNNEAHTLDNIVDELADYIKSIDSEMRPVTTSWEQPHLPSLDLISLHWYENERLGMSDLALLKQIEPYRQYKKPIVFSEQGNKDANWDSFSGDRMRIRAWTAAFNDAGIIFWNTSHRKDYNPPEYKNGNQFIGEEERKYISSLVDFFRDISLDARPGYFREDQDVRSYGLLDDKVMVGYFHGYADYMSQKPMRVSFYLPQPGTVIWYSTKDGSVVSTINLTYGDHILMSPPFRIDIAVKIKMEQQ